MKEQNVTLTNEHEKSGLVNVLEVYSIYTCI